MAESDDLIEQGIAQARSGQREAAYATLRRSLYAEGDSTNLRVWLAATSPSLAEAQTHLGRALELEPDNAQAPNGLRWVAQQLAAGVTAPPSAPAPWAGGPAAALPAPPAFPGEGAAPPGGRSPRRGRAATRAGWAAPRGRGPAQPPGELSVERVGGRAGRPDPGGGRRLCPGDPP